MMFLLEKDLVRPVPIEVPRVLKGMFIKKFQMLNQIFGTVEVVQGNVGMFRQNICVILSSQNDWDDEILSDCKKLFCRDEIVTVGLLEGEKEFEVLTEFSDTGFVVITAGFCRFAFDVTFAIKLNVHKFHNIFQVGFSSRIRDAIVIAHSYLLRFP